MKLKHLPSLLIGSQRKSTSNLSVGGFLLGLPLLICMASADTLPADLIITHNNYPRAVVGSTHEVGFTLSNFATETIPFSMSAIGNLTAPIGFGGVTSPISASADGAVPTQQPWSFRANTAGTPGTSVLVGLTATETGVDSPGIPRSASSSFNLQLLENRTITFSLSNASGTKVSSNGVLDLGRHIGQSTTTRFNTDTGSYEPTGTYAQSALNLTISGGAQSRSLATDVIWNPSTISGFISNGISLKNTAGNSSNLYLSSFYPSGNSSSQTFNGASQSKVLGVAMYGKIGTFSETIRFADASNLGTGFSTESVSGSAISGAALRYSGSQIRVQGTSITNRTIFATSLADNGVTSNGVNVFDTRAASYQTGLFDTDAAKPGIQGRVMMGASGTIAAGSDTWLLTSPGGSTDTARVKFTGSGTVSNGKLLSVNTGTIGGVIEFNGNNFKSVTASWEAGTFGTAAGSTFKTGQSGRIDSVINLSSNLTSAETGGALAGQSMGNLQIGYSLEVVANRPVSVGHMNVKAFNGITVDSLSNEVRSVNGFFTNPTITTQDGFSQVLTNNTNSPYGYGPYVSDQFAVTAGTHGTGSGTRTITVSPEGLAGEAAAYNRSYNWSLSRLDKAQMAVGGSLAGESYVQKTFNYGVETVGAQNKGTFSIAQTNAGPGVANASVSVSTGFYNSPGWTTNSTTSPDGRAASLSFSFNDNGLKNGTYFTYAYVNSQHADQAIIGAHSGDLGSYAFLMEAVITGRADNTGYKGFRKTQFDSVSAQVSEGDSAMEILDIIEDSGERAVTMEILSEEGAVTSPDGQTVGFVSGQITGLDGLKFVLQSTYDEAEIIANFRSESAAALLWKNERGEFVNAVLGNYGNAQDGPNSAFPKVGNRFVGSYADYLVSLGGASSVPLLGDYGYDPVNNKVWAVLDHNSTFGGSGVIANGIPEPSTFAIFLMSASLAFRRRR